MRTTALILGFGLLWASQPAAAETSKSGASAPREARVGSLAPDEARRAERARRRAAAKNAQSASRDAKVTEGKSVAVPGNVPGSKAAEVPSARPAPAAAAEREPPRQEKAAPVKTVVAPSTGNAAVSPPVQKAATDGGRGSDAGPRNADRVRFGDKEARAQERRSKRYAARHKARSERFATGGSGDRRVPRQAMTGGDDPRGALPGAPPYPMAPRPREVYIVRAAPPPPAFWGGFGPRRPFYPAPGYMHDEPIDDVD